MADSQVEIVIRAVNRASKELETVGKSAKSLSTDVRAANRAANDFNKGLNSLRNTALAFAGGLGIVEAVQGIGRALRSTVTTASEFQQGLVGVGKTSNIQGKELQKLGDGFTELSKRIPVATRDLLSIGESAGQLGVKGSRNILKFSETIAKLTRTTNLGGEEAATAIARIFNITGEGIDTVDRFGSVLVALGNNFAVNEREITNVSTNIAQAIGVFGVASRQIAALGAVLQSNGIQAERARSSLQRLFQTAQKATETGGPALNTFAKLAGQTGEEFKQAFKEDAFGAITQFIKGLKEAKDSGASYATILKSINITSLDATSTIQTLAENSTELGKALGISNKAYAKNTALNQEFAQFANTFDSKFQLFINKLQAAAKVVGTQLLPALSRLLEKLSTILEKASSDGSLEEFGKKAASAIDFLTDHIQTLLDLLKVLGTYLAVRMVTSLANFAAGAVAAAGGVARVATAVRLLVASTGVGLLILLASGLAAATSKFLGFGNAAETASGQVSKAQTAIEKLDNQVQRLGDNVVANTKGSLNSAIGQLKEQIAINEQVIKKAKEEQSKATKSRIPSVDAIDAIDTIGTAQRENDKLRKRLSALQDRLKKLPKKKDDGKNTDTPTTPTSETKTIAEGDLTAQRERIQNELSDLKRELDNGEVSIEDYYSKKAALEQKSLDTQIEKLRREQAITKDSNKQKNLNGQILALQLKRQEASKNAAQEQKQAEQKLADQLSRVRDNLRGLTGQGRTFEESKKALQTQYKDLFDRLNGQGDTEGKALLNNFINKKAAKEQFDYVYQQASALKAKLQADLDNIAAKESAGQISKRQKLDQSAAAKNTTGAELAKQLPALQKYAKIIGDPTLQTKIKELQSSVITLGDASVNAFKAIGASALDNLSSGLQGVLQGTQSLGSAFQSFALQAVQAIEKVIIKMILLKAIEATLNAVAPGSGSAFSAAASSSGFARGGAVRGPGTGTSDSIPARLSDGEYVLRQRAVSHYGVNVLDALNRMALPKMTQPSKAGKNVSRPSYKFAAGGLVTSGGESGGNGTQGVRIVNVIDPSITEQFLQSPQGEKVIFNVLGNNPTRLKALQKKY